MKDFIFRQDAKSKGAREYFESVWSMKRKLTYADVAQVYINKGIDGGSEIDAALHMVIGAFLEGEANMFAETAEFTNPQIPDVHKSGLELWRLLNNNFDRTSSVIVVGLVDHIRNMQSAKNIQHVIAKRMSPERVRQEYYKTAMASKDPDFEKMRKLGISVYP